MGKLFRSYVAVCVLIGLAQWAGAQEPSEIIAKALKAHGGKEVLLRYKDKAVMSKSKGKMDIMGGIEMTMENYVQPGGKFRSDRDLQIAGTTIKQTILYNGDKFVLTVNGMDVSNALDDKMKKEIKEQLGQEKMVAKILLGDKGVELSPLGENTIEGKVCLGLRATAQGHRDLSLWFDKASGLLTALDQRAIDFMSQEEKNQRTIFSEYKEVDGYQSPTKVLVNQDDKKLIELEILEIKIQDKFDDSLFDKP